MPEISAEARVIFAEEFRRQVRRLSWQILTLLVPLALGEKAAAVLEPGRNLDLGQGKGKAMEAELTGGVVGVVLDGRGRRPFQLPDAPAQRVEMLREWNEALTMYGRSHEPALASSRPLK